jgi:peptidoglycan hydrolase-like protein with peptidoglycan-binding domain
MQLQGRNLSLRMQGEDVKLLQNELRQLGFRVDSRTGFFGAATRQTVLAFQKKQGIETTGIVNERTATLINAAVDALRPQPAQPATRTPPEPTPPKAFVVAGQVRRADGSFLAGSVVVALDKDLRGERELGRTKTDAQGSYRIEYPVAQVAGGKKGTVALLVRVYGADAAGGPGPLLVASDISFNAKPIETIDLMVGGAVYKGPSEFEQVMADLTPLLGRLTPADLVESADSKDISYLTGETSRSPVQLAMWSVAFRLAKTTSVPPEIFFGLLRENIPPGAATMVMVRDQSNALNLDANAQQALDGILASKQAVRAKAVDAAIRDNIIPFTLQGSAQKSLAALQDLAVNRALTQPVGRAKTALGAVFDAVSIPKDIQTAFITLYSDYMGSMRRFWQDLSKNTSFTAQEVANLKFAHDINRLTKGHIPLIAALAQMRQTGSIHKTSDLGRFDEADWTAVLNRPSGGRGQPIGAPIGLDVPTYAHFLATGFERAYPTAAFAGRLTKDAQSPVAARADVLTFLSNNPKFSLLRTNLDRYLKDQAAAALTGVRSPSDFRASLTAVQRVAKLASLYSLIKPLIADNIHSAQQIYAMGRDRFVGKYGANPAIGSNQAQQIYARAEQNYGRALAMVANFNLSFTSYSPVAVRDQSAAFEAQQAVKDFPNLQTMFGSLDLCQCDDCRSVLSPAAYLVDILHFLNQRLSNGPANPSRSVKDVLFDRRPDLGRIELSCPNTNVPLPYIDLANEILEDAVNPPASPTGRQTTGTAEELATNPEYVNEAAYTTLSAAVFPWTLPFNLPLEEARVYLGHLNVSRVDLMRVFQPPAAASSPQAHTIAIESLGLSSMEAQIITPAALTATYHSWDFWGLTEDGHNTNGNAVVDPVDPTIAFTGDWIAVLSHVRVMMNRAGLSFGELSQLLNTQFVNGDRSLSFQADPVDDCDLAKMAISGLTPDILDRVRGFVRLWRKLGWTIYELDKAVMGLQGGGTNLTAHLNDTLLWQLYQVQCARKALSLPVVSVLVFWATLDTADVPPLPGETVPQYCLYNTLFQNKAVVNPVDPVFRLNAGGTEIAGAGLGEKISGHKATILAALGVTDADLTLASGQITPNDKLNLANLSALYRHFTLASAMGISIKELLSLKALTEIDPFNGARPELLSVFLPKAQKVAHSDFKVEQLDYLLRHVYTDASGLSPQNIVVGTLIREIRNGLLKILADNAFSSDPTGVATRKKLATVLKPADVDTTMGILGGTSALSAADQATFIANTLSAFLDIATAQANLVGAVPPALPAGQPRYEYVLSALLTYLGRTQSVGYTVQKLTDAVQADAAVVRGLLTAYLKARFDPSKPSVEEYLRLPSVPRGAGASDSTPIDPVAEPDFQRVCDTYRLLHKCATIFSAFKMPASEVAWLFTNGMASTRTDAVTGLTTGWLDPTGLPLAPVDKAGAAFLSWERVADFITLRNTLPAGQDSITKQFDEARATGPAVSKAQFFQSLNNRTQWTMANLEVLGGAGANDADLGLLGLQYPADYTDELGMVRMLPCFRLIKSLGISADVGKWIGTDVQQNDADALKNAVKAKYPGAQWLAVAKPLRDALRIRQRDALVAYLLAKPPATTGWFRDVNDIYAYYLIDVQMSPCQLTARLKQAAASVQLFVQRCLLNAETDVVADANGDSDWLQWKWMEYYRVWQADREIFLYPENWIAPELRKDKSPFFTELENELLQSDITQDSAETAFQNYLEKLDQVARLSVVGTYYEAELEGSILHVIARTQTSPTVYFHRRRVNGARWTAWQKIDLDITSDHVMPIVWNRRVHLFWLIFTNKPNQDTAFNLPAAQPSAMPPSPPRTHWEIQLAWSEFKDGKWQAKRTAPQILIADGSHQPYVFTVRTTETGAALAVDIFFQGSWLTWGTSSGPLGAFPHPVLHTGFPHIAEYLLSGIGNQVQAFVVPGSIADLPNASDQTRDVLALPPSFVKPDLITPYATSNDAASFSPLSVSPLSGNPSRQVASLNVLYNFYGTLTNEELLGQADRYKILVPHQDLLFDSTLPFFLQDTNHSYFVVPSIFYRNGNYFLETRPAYVYNPFYITKYRLFTNYHPFVPLFIQELNHRGIDGLLKRDIQLTPTSVGPAGMPALDFNAYYQPTGLVQPPYPVEDVDFDYDATYAIYNWELFFHVPLLIANALSRNQRFDEARRWYQYIFDPTSATADPLPQRYWITRPFFEMTAADYQSGQINNLLALVAQSDANAEFQVTQWRNNPFDPHVIAGLRPIAYQRNVVMRYIDNLIAWGDQLFRRDTIESINEATQLYVLAQELLGPRPQIVPAQAQHVVMTYNDLEPNLDAFSNELVAVENILSPPTVSVASDLSAPKLPTLPTLYFCVPPNEDLLAYWDTVNDRLFKIRHCMNLAGVVRQLPLYESPIDPGLLVRAAAAGLDLDSVLNDVNAPLPHYRFAYMLPKARELVSEVRGLGAALLQALEKRDAEALALLRSSGEVHLLNAAKAVKQRQYDEATQNIDTLTKTEAMVTERRNYYRDIVTPMNDWERASMALSAASLIPDIASIVHESIAAAAHLVPDIQFGASGFGGTPVFYAKIGGENIGQSSSKTSNALRIASSVLHATSQMSAVFGGYQRRADDWGFQRQVADLELNQISSQLISAQIRQDIADKENTNFDIQIDNATQADQLLHGKYTNQDLYEWMIAQTAAVYFQSYQLAYDIARQAERCYRYELGLATSSFIQFGYWDSLKKGLLAGDKLDADLLRMEMAYMDANARELELTKHISLLSLDPIALVKLRENGSCAIELPELLFDLDTPGHYMRRVKSVALTIPCVAGPYTNISATLTLLQNSVRMSTDVTAGYRRTGPNDPRFRDEVGWVDTIVTSTAQNDAGMFEINFRDDRYLPFEGSGAVSLWSLKLTSLYPQFDYRTMSDVILHLRYTARDAGDAYRGAAVTEANAQLNAITLAESRNGLYRLLSAQHDFPSSWQRFLYPPANTDQTLLFDTAPGRFPFFTRGLQLNATSIELIAKLSDTGPYVATLIPPGSAALSPNPTLTQDGAYGAMHHSGPTPFSPGIELGRWMIPSQDPALTQWSLQLQKSGAADFRSLSPTEIDDILIVLKYEVKPES